MKCPNCNQKLPDNARFCHGCGEAVIQTGLGLESSHPTPKTIDFGGTDTPVLAHLLIALIFLMVATAYGMAFAGWGPEAGMLILAAGGMMIVYLTRPEGFQHEAVEHFWSGISSSLDVRLHRMVTRTDATRQYVRQQSRFKHMGAERDRRMQELGHAVWAAVEKLAEENDDDKLVEAYIREQLGEDVWQRLIRIDQIDAQIQDQQARLKSISDKGVLVRGQLRP